MGVTVSPVKIINVRVNAQSPQRVTGTSIFYGSSNALSEANTALTIAQEAFNEANTALIIAQESYNEANNKVSRAGDTMTGSLVIEADITANNANFNRTTTVLDAGFF